METLVVLSVCRTEIPTINCLKKVRSHRRTVNQPVRRRMMRGLRQDSGAPVHILNTFWKVVRVCRRNLPLTRTCWYELPSSLIGEPLAGDARVEIEHRNSLLEESFLSDDAEKPGGDMCAVRKLFDDDARKLTFTPQEL